MKKILFAFAIAALTLMVGCEQSAQKGGSSGEAELLTVDFEQGRTLTYNMVSSRDITLDLMEKSSKSGKEQKMLEKLEMVVSYVPVEVDPYGLSKIRAEIKSANVTRKSFTGKSEGSRDAAESLAGKSFTFTISPSGRIEDYTSFNELVVKVGETSIKDSGNQGRIKDPDMIWDFIAMHRDLWSAMSGVPKPSRGVAVGEKWQVEQVVPLPMPIPKFMNTDYTFAGIEGEQGSRVAVLNSEYSLSESEMSNFEDIESPFGGRFRLRGMFGFLRNYRFNELTGSGNVKYDLDRGVLLEKQGQYDLDMNADFLMPLGDSKPVLKLVQHFDIELVED